MKKVGIYVITHKKYKECVPSDFKIYKNLLVGVSVGNVGEKDYLKDNVGDNISYKNKSYCELTGMYWIWKNSTDEIVGLEHYRRYFVKYDSSARFLDNKDVNDVLSYCDIILPKKQSFYKYTVEEQFKQYHDPIVWDKCKEIIQEKYPNYKLDYDWLSQQNAMYCYNMLICTKENWDNYCKWLFDILQKLKEEIDISKYDSYNQRVFGFISERLLNVWIHHNKMKVKEFPVYFTEYTTTQKIKNLIKRTVPSFYNWIKSR